MSNKPNFSKVVSLAEFREERAQAGNIDIDLGDGSPPVVIPAAELWPDDLPSSSREPDAFAAAIVGADEWERFKAAGGTFKLFNAIYDKVTKERQGADPAK